MTEAEKWDSRYRQAHMVPAAPAPVLSDNIHLLPARGVALDLACGLGGNAVCLASHGLDTKAWDISAVAIGKLAARAQGQGLSVDARVCDVLAHPPPPESFDVIVVAHFLERSLTPAIASALRPGGLVFYQAHVRESVTDRGPRNPQFRLAPNELLRLFAGLRTVFYREEGRIGDQGRGFRDQVMYIGMRPGSRGGACFSPKIM